MIINVKTKKVNVADVKINDYIKSYDLSIGVNRFNRVNEIIPSEIEQGDQVQVTLENSDQLICSRNTRIFINTHGQWDYMYVYDLLTQYDKVDCYMLSDSHNKIKINKVECGCIYAPTNFIDFNVSNDHNFYVKRPNDVDFKLIHNSGACTVSLDSWHMDIEDFLELQTENGDQRMKAFDIFPQLVLTDEFMRRVDENKTWTLVDPYEIKTKLGYNLPELWGKDFEQAYSHIENMINSIGTEKGIDLSTMVDEHFDETYKTLIKNKNTLNNTNVLKLVKRINAKELFKTVMKTQIETGMPYLTFKDAINRANPNKHRGYIPAGNLCQESFSNVKPTTQSKYSKNNDGSWSKTVTGGEVHTCLVGETELEVKIDGVETKETLEYIISLLALEKQVYVKSFNHDTDKVEYALIEHGKLMKENADLMRITLVDDTIIECTPDHRIWTENRGYVEAQNLLETDILKTT